MVQKTKTPSRIYVVDDEDSICEMLTVALERDGNQVSTNTDPTIALAEICADEFDLVIHDLKMPSLPGIELLAEIKKAKPDMLVIVMTAFSSWDTAVEAMRLGAYDYIRKPFDNDLIRSTVAKALEQKRVYENYYQKGGQFKPLTMIGSSPEIKKVSAFIRRVAKTDSTVMVTGESGTGKEVVARSLHSSSLRAHQPFIGLNCGAFTESLLESELFGHIKGAFTGAVADKKGLLSLADGGTLFLDEIGEMTLSTQVKFLKILEDREFYAVGGVQAIKMDVRIIAATNRDLHAAIKERNFREDLFYRLNVIPICLPALRERREDIPLLAGHFLADYANKMKLPARRFSNSSMEQLVSANWPGNIRELENIIQRAVVMSEGEIIETVDVGASGPLIYEEAHDNKTQNSGGLATTGQSESHSNSPSELNAIPPEGINLEKKLEEIEKGYMESALKQSNYHMTNAAKLLNMTFRSFRYKVKKYDIDVNH